MIKWLVLLYFFLSTYQVYGQNPSTYRNDVDELYTIKKVSFLPSYDNIDDIFAKPMDQLVQENIESNHQWEFIPSNMSKVTLTPDELIVNPSRTKGITSGIKADAIFFGGIRKNPKDMFIELNLFSLKNGKLLSRASTQVKAGTNLEEMKSEINKLYASLVRKIPYDGLILSRTGNRVTVDVGTINGATPGAELSVTKIIDAKRHPKLGFILKTEKDIIGKIRLVKTDKYLSFGDIVTEKEPGVVSKDAKVVGLNFIKYNNRPWIKSSRLPPKMIVTRDNIAIFGDDPDEWRPEIPPTFGKIGAEFFIGEYANTLSLRPDGSNNGKNLEASTFVFPKIQINGEIWINPTWYASFMFGQGIVALENPLGGANLATTQTHTLLEYNFGFGANFLVRDDFFGPKVYTEVGFFSYRMGISDVAGSLNTLKYRALYLQFGGITPISPGSEWYAGGEATFYMWPAMDEGFTTSGSDDDNTVVQFKLFGEKEFGSRLRGRAGLEFKSFKSEFTGDGARNPDATDANHRFIQFSLGINYMF